MNTMEQSQSGIPQVPSENVIAEQPQMQNGPQPITEEEKQKLLAIIKQIREKLGSLNATQFASNNKTEQIRQDLLKKVFEKLQVAGVDLTDNQSVSDFLLKLKEDNPELAGMFEQAMDVLLGGEAGGSFSDPQDPNAVMDLNVPQNNMNNDINPDEIQTIPPNA